MHRHLRWTSPHMKGDDVKKLQHALGVPADGDYGQNTANAVELSKELLGFENKDWTTGASDFYQKILFGETKAPAGYYTRAQAAEKRHAASQDAGEKAVDWLAPFVGKTERDGINRGSWGLDQWQIEAGHPTFSSSTQIGWPWCGVTVHAAYLHGAKINLDNRVVSVEWISAAARAGTGGLYAVSKQQIRKGDLLTLFGNDHVELARKNYDPKDPHEIPTRGGNTSFADGSQNDGGALADKTRRLDDIVTVARVRIA